MTEEEIKKLDEPAVETVEIEVEQPRPQKSAADEAAEKLQQQLQSAQAAEKAARETAEAERQARIAAEQQAQAHAQQATQFRGQVQSEQLNTISTAIDGSTREREMAKVELKRAMEAGEWDKVAEAQDTLSLANARIVQLEQMKYAAMPADTPRVNGRVDQPRPQQQTDPVEQFISSAPTASQSWLRQHRDLIKSDGRGVRLDSRVLAAHYQAEADGIQVESPEYFKFVEDRVKPPEQRQDTHQQAKQRTAPVAAPVSRESSSNGGSQRITLTKDQVEAAHAYGDPKKSEREREIEYWNNLQALKSEGRIGNYQH